ncbi:uncharacterized protein LOC117226995 isoform X2 [Megalopta genalis]|uniref:uncharacterized protein LOC117226995 isoform X2 n=1 Tax=Megalopta genalis TaxID=115081 RepID=UPI003FD6B9D0
MIFVPRGSHTVLALIITHLVISMPAPPVKRSPELTGDPRNGFSSVPKILEIQLPLKIATKDDLVAWAKYVMGLMASRINITLATVKDTTENPLDPTRNPSNYKQMQSFKTSGFKNLDPGKPAGAMKAYAKNFETSRYAENVKNYDRNKGPAEFRIQDTNKYPEKSRIPAPRKESVISTPSLQAFTTGPLTAKNFLGIRPTTFATLGIGDTTVHSPFEIKANINVARPEIKESLIKSTFDMANALKINEQQLFVPTFPDFGVFSPKNIDIFNAETVPPPPRTYLPVTTTDNIRFPSDSFATRYFFDGIERNVTSNLGILPVDLRYTTIKPVSFGEEIPLPVKSLELATRKNSTSPPKRILNVPFEAVITFTREAKIEPTTSKSDNEKQFIPPTRDPPDAFPPYFDNNFTVTNESGQINVVFDDGSQVTEKVNATKKSERKKKKKEKEREKDKDKERDKEKDRDKERPKKPSMIAQLLKVFTALRNTPNANNSLSVDLSPPPLKPPLSFPLPQRAPQKQEPTPPPRPPQSFPQRQQGYPQSPQSYPQSPQTYPQKPQTYPQHPQTYPPKASESRQGRRNQTSLAQELEDDDDDGDSGNSGEDKSEEDKSEEDKSDQDEGSKPKDEVESDEDNGGSSESSSDESDYSDEDDGEGGSVQAIINLLELAAPILEDLSDPESDTNISDVLEAAVPLLEDLSNGDGVNPGFDVAGILVPILLQISGGPEGMGDSVAILTPLLQVLAPLIGPLSGPLLVPLSRQSSNPPNQGASSSGNLIMNLSGPLSESGPGMTSMLQKLVAGVVSSLSKNSGGGSDITSLIKAIVAGSISGTSASSSGPRGDSYGAPTSYGGDSYGYGGQPNRPPPTNQRFQFGGFGR